MNPVPDGVASLKPAGPGPKSRGLKPAIPGDYAVRPVVGDCPPATLRSSDLARGWAAPLKGRVLILEIRPE